MYCHRDCNKKCIPLLMNKQLLLWNSHSHFIRQLTITLVNKLSCKDKDLITLNQNILDIGDNFGQLLCCHNQDCTGKCCDYAVDTLTRHLVQHTTLLIEIILALINHENIDVKAEEWMKSGDNIGIVYGVYHQVKMLKGYILRQYILEYFKSLLVEIKNIIKNKCGGKDNSTLDSARLLASYINDSFIQDDIL